MSKGFKELQIYIDVNWGKEEQTNLVYRSQDDKPSEWTASHVISLIGRLQKFQVQIKDETGTIVTPKLVRDRYSSGSISLDIHVLARTEQGAKAIETRIHKIIEEEDY